MPTWTVFTRRVVLRSVQTHVTFSCRALTVPWTLPSHHPYFLKLYLSVTFPFLSFYFPRAIFRGKSGCEIMALNLLLLRRLRQRFKNSFLVREVEKDRYYHFR